MLLLCFPLWAFKAESLLKKQSSEEQRYVLLAVQIDAPPKLDGFLEKEIWEQAPVATHFIQKQPDEGQLASENTEVRILYNKESLYIGIMCYDSEPEKIIATEKRRDSESIYDNDHIQILLDTFRDRRNGFIFVTNPLGAKLDLQIRREGKIEASPWMENPNVNTNWDGVWRVKSAIRENGWSAEIEIPFFTLRFKENSSDGWGLNLLRNIRRKNEESTWAPLARNFKIHKISLAGDLKGLEGLEKGLNLQVKPFILGDRVFQRNDGEILSSTNSISGGLDLKYGLSSNLTLELTANTDFSQVEADDQQINLTRFSLFFPEKRDFFLENAALFNIGSQEDAMIFFSRRIGISSQGDKIPLLGGVKTAGKLGKFNVGLISLQSQAKGDVASNNFSVLRVGRDILGKSAIGFLVTNRQSSVSGDFNRAFAFDGDFIIGENLSITGYMAFTSSPEIRGKNRAGKLRFQWVSDYWDISGYYFDVQENFNAEMGFVKRTGIRKYYLQTAFTPEPKLPGIRRLNPHIRFEYTTDQEDNLLLSKTHIDWAMDLMNGGRFSFQWNKEHEFVDIPFPIQEDITLLVGTYKDSYWEASLRGNKSRNFWTDVRYRWSGFYGGKGRILQLTVGFRPLPSFDSELHFVHNDIDLSQGAFINHLLRVRLNYNFSIRLALMSLVQWNSDTGEVNVNMRLNYIHTPGSDLYIVYNERRLVEGLETGILDRTIALKFTYLFNF